MKKSKRKKSHSKSTTRITFIIAALVILIIGLPLTVISLKGQQQIQQEAAGKPELQLSVTHFSPVNCSQSANTSSYQCTTAISASPDTTAQTISWKAVAAGLPVITINPGTGLAGNNPISVQISIPKSSCTAAQSIGTIDFIDTTQAADSVTAVFDCHPSAVSPVPSGTPPHLSLIQKRFDPTMCDTTTDNDDYDCTAALSAISTGGNQTIPWNVIDEFSALSTDPTSGIAQKIPTLIHLYIPKTFCTTTQGAVNFHFIDTAQSADIVSATFFCHPATIKPRLWISKTSFTPADCETTTNKGSYDCITDISAVPHTAENTIPWQATSTEQANVSVNPESGIAVGKPTLIHLYIPIDACSTAQNVDVFHFINTDETSDFSTVIFQCSGSTTPSPLQPHLSLDVKQFNPETCSQSADASSYICGTSLSVNPSTTAQIIPWKVLASGLQVISVDPPTGNAGNNPLPITITIPRSSCTTTNGIATIDFLATNQAGNDATAIFNCNANKTAM